MSVLFGTIGIIILLVYLSALLWITLYASGTQESINLMNSIPFGFILWFIAPLFLLLFMKDFYESTYKFLNNNWKQATWNIENKK